MEFEKLKNLPSGKKDEERIKFVFTALGFDVQVHQNLKAAEIKATVEGYSQMEHTGAFFLIISSHGGPYDPDHGITDDAVCGTDGVKVKVHDLEKLFHATKCPSLAGIPKVFVIDACRGRKVEPVYLFTSKSESSGTSSTMGVMDSADIMTIFASTRGHIAGCNASEGSYLIQTFLKVLIKITKDKNVTDIMKTVQREIGKPQTPQNSLTFSKSYYIKKFVLYLFFIIVTEFFTEAQN